MERRVAEVARGEAIRVAGARGVALQAAKAAMKAAAMKVALKAAGVAIAAQAKCK